ncbi:hypothetical protein Q5P01_013217 [Channa striata]|uniref:Uncharacterized protein n=1 Tax=Channa striata TaxID=64152 RepID=A0AA88MIY4_CHASR|nr:hypothetical protein Q5P01_013217 [Channa striata]
MRVGADDRTPKVTAAEKGSRGGARGCFWDPLKPLTPFELQARAKRPSHLPPESNSMLHALGHGVRQIQEEPLRSPTCKLHGEGGGKIQVDEGRESLLGPVRNGLCGQLPSGQPSAAGVRPEALRGDRGAGRAAVGGG